MKVKQTVKPSLHKLTNNKINKLVRMCTILSSEKINLI